MTLANSQGAVIAVSHDEEFVNRLVNGKTPASAKSLIKK
jgi:ATPase subunit of ABC transporter with duplicated ATPase domains